MALLPIERVIFVSKQGTCVSNSPCSPGMFPSVIKSICALKSNQIAAVYPEGTKGQVADVQYSKWSNSLLKSACMNSLSQSLGVSS